MHNPNTDTMTFSLGNEQEIEIRRILTAVYDALKEKGLKDGDTVVLNGYELVYEE